MTSQFEHAPLRTIMNVVDEVRALPKAPSIICVSGDTDPFVDEAAGMDLLETLATEFPDKHLMFTTRLVPGDGAVSRLADLNEEMSMRRRLLVPGISVVSLRFPNSVERSKAIPPTTKRLEFMAALATSGLPCLLAMRPTFPFHVVSPREVRALIAIFRPYATVVLGEKFILDQPGQIERRLGLELSQAPNEPTPLTFLQQPGVWRKILYPEETKLVAETCAELDIPFFMRSGTAMRLLNQAWDFSRRTLTTAMVSDVSDAMDDLDP
jgi:hypothetical protein